MTMSAAAMRAPVSDGYGDFLETKQRQIAQCGFAASDLNPNLFRFQQDIVRWAARLGRAAIFADCGMGKGRMQLEWGRLVFEKTDGDVLILAPLAVAGETVREAHKFGLDAPFKYCRSQSEVRPGLTIANYEMLEHFDVSKFAGVVLDESSILKAYNGKTRNQIITAFADTPYRLACTATPAPNDFMELGNHAEFLGVMTRSEMLSMYFVHDGGSTQDWRIKGHVEDEFWRWVCRWAVMIRKPSDLGYDDTGFVLPKLHTIGHVIETGRPLANTLSERRAARRESLSARVAKVAELVAAKPDEPWLLWCDLNPEGDALEALVPGAVQVAGSDRPALKEERMVGFAEGRVRVLVSKPSICGFGMNFQVCNNMAFVGLSDSYEKIYQAIRRCWRFGQLRPVNAHVVTADAEGAVVANIKRKEADAMRMAEKMVANMKAVMNESVHGTQRDFSDYAPGVEIRLPSWLRTEENAA